MINLGDILLITLTLPLYFWSFHHERLWRKRLRTWKKSQGIVVGSKLHNDSKYPVIEYSHFDSPKRFTSKYGCALKSGATVHLVISPDGTDVEHMTFQNRWLFTIAPLVLALIFTYSLLSTPLCQRSCPTA